MNRIILPQFILICTLLTACQTSQTQENQMNAEMNDPNHLNETVADHKIIVYQIFTRLFGNTRQTNKEYGTLEENGVGKFNDISSLALQELKEMGITHVWYTGVLEHATMTDYTRYGIPLDDADVVKGRAGSPYAIKDYYDVNPDLAVRVPDRLNEFQALIDRTHQEGLKVLIDFVPNHVARAYRSDARPAGIKDLGEGDDVNQTFAPNNNFYYLPGTSFVVPREHQPLGNLPHPTKNGRFDETPAKVTGNDQFTPAPSVHDWFETVKLNYGIDIPNNRSRHFDPAPDTWEKMRDILQYWTGKGVDGFRCDMAEMVPVEFWNWVIPQIQSVNPDIIFIAEIYNPAEYRNYLETGKFTYLYDKVGLYDSLKAVMQERAGTSDLTVTWKNLQGINNQMLRFLENHDEQRIASPDFAGDARKAIPAMVITATLNSGPVMVYFGQEVGEPGRGKAGFSGEDGRTTIFDYWGVPEHQKWVNGGKFDGALLSTEQKQLRAFYSRLLNLCRENEAIRKGGLYDLQSANAQSPGYDGRKLYAYLRYTEASPVLVVVNFDAQHRKDFSLNIPENAFRLMGLPTEGRYQLRNLLMDELSADFTAGAVSEASGGGSYTQINLSLEPLGAYIFALEKN